MPCRDELRGPRRLADGTISYCGSTKRTKAQYHVYPSALDDLESIDAHNNHGRNNAYCILRSESDLVTQKHNIFPGVLRHLAFLLRRKDANTNCLQPCNPGDWMVASENGKRLPVDVIKQRWRRRQIAIQQGVAPQRCLFWGGWTRSHQ